MEHMIFFRLDQPPDDGNDSTENANGIQNDMVIALANSINSSSQENRLKQQEKIESIIEVQFKNLPMGPRSVDIFWFHNAILNGRLAIFL